MDDLIAAAAFTLLGRQFTEDVPDRRHPGSFGGRGPGRRRRW
ncbi:hypothetical protein ABZ912_61350 [Nonomuraea angiospora]